MTTNDQLTLLSIAGVIIAFISGLIPQFMVTTREKGLRKFQTPAGVAALAVSGLSLLISLSSEMLKVYLGRQEEIRKTEEQAAAAEKEQARQRAAAEQQEEQRRWQRRSDALVETILNNTARQLTTSERTMAEMLRGFEEEQARQRQTVAEIQTGTRRMLLRLGEPAFTVSAGFSCSESGGSAYCAAAREARAKLAAEGAAVPAIMSVQTASRFTVYFALPQKGETVRLSGGSVIAGKVDLYGRLRLPTARSQEGPLIQAYSDRIYVSTVRTKLEDIPPAVSETVSSMLDLAGRTILVWGSDLEGAASLNFAITSESNYQMGTKCRPLRGAVFPESSGGGPAPEPVFACKFPDGLF